MKKKTLRVAALTILLFLTPLYGNTQSIVYNNEGGPLDTIHSTPGFTAIFSSWGFIGDSLCSGEMESLDNNGKKGYHDMYNFSWGQFICRACGVEGYNFSHGGQTAKGWIEEAGERGWAFAKTHPKQAYIIAMGVNDFRLKYKTGDLSTDVNKTDYTKNAPTYAGYMAGIVQRIQSIQPRAKIFVVTRPKEKAEGNDWDCYNEVVRQLPKYFKNIYVIDLYRYAPVYDKEFKDHYFVGGHMNVMGYQLTANMFMTYIDWIIRKNYKEFKQSAFIGTNLSYPETTK
ncbi:MAG: SGNH/GDSL hydrolase family protein [Prevotella sp.]|nr:SGNH/GDSL hydrolase family protein [Prevotella sp.]